MWPGTFPPSPAATGGRISIYEYALFLRNLIPVYRALEAGLTRHRRTAGVGQLYQPAVFRSEALESDLRAIVGVSWQQSLPLLAAADRYAQRVTSAADGSGGGLISHAYVRYLGDLNGGQVLQEILSRVLGLRVSALAFYEFPLISDLQAFKSDYRRLVDLAGLENGNRMAIVEEALVAFRLNIDLSEEVEVAGG